MMKNVLGLDLGSHSVKAVELRQSLSGIEPAQMRSQPAPTADLPPGEELRRFVELHALPLDHVVCAISGDRVTHRRLEFPFRDRKRLRAAVPFAVEGEIPLPLDSVFIDWELVGGDRGRAELAATVVQREEVVRLLEDLSQWGCDPRIVEAEGLALANLASVFDLPGTRLIADLGHRKSVFCLLVDGHPVVSRCVPIGGATISEGIAKDRQCSSEDAERSKCEEGLFEIGFETPTPRGVAPLDRLAREMVRTLESVEVLLGGTPERRVDGISLCGGTARLHRLDEYLAERTGIETTRLSGTRADRGQDWSAVGDPVLFAPALALALRGTAEARTHMDFRQGELAYRTDFSQYIGREWRWTLGLAAFAVVLWGLQIGGDISLQSRRAAAFEREAKQLYVDAFPDQPVPEAPVPAMRAALDAAQQRAEFLGVYSNGSALDLLGELSRRVPADLEVRFEEVSIDHRLVRAKVTARGFDAADRLERELQKSQLFTAAKAGEVTTDRTTGSTRFDLSIRLEAPVAEDS